MDNLKEIIDELVNLEQGDLWDGLSSPSNNRRIKQTRSLLKQEIDETIDIIEKLMQYGNIHPIKGVIYPGGTHEEYLKKASEWLNKNRQNESQST